MSASTSYVTQRQTHWCLEHHFVLVCGYSICSDILFELHATTYLFVQGSIATIFLLLQPAMSFALHRASCSERLDSSFIAITGYKRWHFLFPSSTFLITAVTSARNWQVCSYLWHQLVKLFSSRLTHPRSQTASWVPGVWFVFPTSGGVGVNPLHVWGKYDIIQQHTGVCRQFLSPVPGGDNLCIHCDWF